MDIRILDRKEYNIYCEDIYQMLILSDKEFVPPLSARLSTTQANLTERTENADGIRQYFDAMMEQKIMVVTESGELFAFMSFRENYEHEYIDCLPNVYISTLIVKAEGRGKGLTKQMYRYLLGAYPDSTAYTRTWSTNYAHTKILSDLGFGAMKILKNDRGDGVDTVYYKNNRRSML